MHLSTFLAKHGYGLASVCDQVGEAVHHDMVPVFQRHKVAEDNQKYGDQLGTSVTKFSSWNLYNMGEEKKKETPEERTKNCAIKKYNNINYNLS